MRRYSYIVGSLRSDDAISLAHSPGSLGRVSTYRHSVTVSAGGVAGTVSWAPRT